MYEENKKTAVRKRYTYFLNSTLCNAFKSLAVLTGKSASRALEEAMIDYITKHKRDIPENIVITEPINKKLADSLKLKLIIEKLTKTTGMLKKIKNKQITNQNAVRFWNENIREILPDAIRLYEKTADKKLEKLLKEAETLL